MTRHQRLLIIDFGSRLTQQIARQLRGLGIYCEIHPWQNVDDGFLAAWKPQAIVLSGSSTPFGQAGAPRPVSSVFSLGVPVLGIGYGQKAMIKALGGELLTSGGPPSADPVTLNADSVRDPSLLLNGLFEGGTEQLWMSASSGIKALPAGFVPLIATADAPFVVVGDPDRRLYGVQFHPEVALTSCGDRFMQNFARIAGFSGDWTMATYRQEAIMQIREQVGDRKVICALSGGVDSSVTALLLHEAIGDNLTCVFVDHGLMRKDEPDQVVTMFRDHFSIHLIHADESERFLTALEGIADPEEKRKIIGRLFIDVFQEHAGDIAGVEFLAQGTVYPDVIESASGAAGVAVKSHHNVGGLPEKMGLKLVEPLRQLFKDEVRALGHELGLPDAFIGRHPFPGPGLAIRCPAEVTREKLVILREADAVYIDQIRRHGLYDAIWQAFAAILPLRTVGVSGGARTYDYAISLRAVTSVDGMSAEFYPFSHDFLAETSARIINEVQGVNRVLFDVTSKPPGTIELE